MYVYFFFLKRYSSNRALVAHLLTFLDHTKLDRHPKGPLWTSDQLVAEAATYTPHNKHKRPKCIPSAGFQTAIPTIGRPQAHALDRMTTGTYMGRYVIKTNHNSDLASFYLKVACDITVRKFDVCVTVHNWYNNINSQLDATIIILLIILIISTCFGR